MGFKNMLAKVALGLGVAGALGACETPHKAESPAVESPESGESKRPMLTVSDKDFYSVQADREQLGREFDEIMDIDISTIDSLEKAESVKLKLESKKSYFEQKYSECSYGNLDTTLKTNIAAVSSKLAQLDNKMFTLASK